MNARSPEGKIAGQLFIGNDEVVARNQKFYIKNEQGEDILYADKDEIRFTAGKLEFLSKHFTTSWCINWCIKFMYKLVYKMCVNFHL